MLHLETLESIEQRQIDDFQDLTGPFLKGINLALFLGVDLATAVV